MLEELSKDYVAMTRAAAKQVAMDRGLDLVHQVACARIATVCLDRGHTMLQALNACDLFAKQLTGQCCIRPGETWGQYYKRLGAAYQSLNEQPIADDDIPAFLKIQAE